MQRPDINTSLAMFDILYRYFVFYIVARKAELALNVFRFLLCYILTVALVWYSDPRAEEVVLVEL